MKKLRGALIGLLLLTVLLFSAACGSSKGDNKTTVPGTTAPGTAAPGTTVPGTTAPAEPSYLTVIGNGSTDYKIIFAQKSDFTGLSALAVDLRSLAASAFGVSGMPFGNDTATVAAYEILIGDTNRPESAAIASRLAETASNEYFQLVVAEMNGKIILYADNSAAYSYSYLYNYFLANYVKSDSRELKIEEGTFDRSTVTFAAHEEYLLRLEEEAKQKICDALIRQIDAFQLSGFGSIETLSSSYDKPPVYPSGSHPRLFVTPETLPTVKANLTHPENLAAYQKMLALSEEATTGVLPKKEDGTHNYNQSILP